MVYLCCNNIRFIFIIYVEDVEELLTPVEPNKPTQQEEARGGMDLQQLWELIKGDSRKNKEELDKKFESINDNFKKIDEKFDRNEESNKRNIEALNETLTQKMKEENKLISEKIDKSNQKTSETLR